jgi:PAS domain S-box-containing protein
MTKLHDRLLQITQDGVGRFILRSGRILSANPGWAGLVEFPEHLTRMVGETVDRLMPPVDGPPLRELIAETKDLQSFDYRFLTPAGCARRVVAHVVLVHDRQLREKVVEAVFRSPGNQHDIDTRSAWLNILVEHTSEAFLVHDDQGRLLEANGRACGMLGYAGEELIGRDLRDLVAGSHEEMAADLWRQVRARGPTTIDVYLQRKDGTRYPAELRVSLLDSSGQARWLCLIRDTSGPRRQEDEVQRLRVELERETAERSEQLESTSHKLRQELAARQRTEEAWREQSGFLSVLLETVPVPIFFKDTEGRYVGCNRAFEQFLGMPRERIVGKSVYEIAPAGLAEVCDKADRELLKSGGAQRYESQVSAARGMLREVVFHKAVFHRGDGRCGGLVGAIMDVTERHTAEREIRALNEALRERAIELETANRELQTFGYSVSHDLRAPLRAITGFSEALEEDLATVPAGPVHEHLGRIRAAARRMDELIEDLLKLSRVLRTEMHRAPIDLSQLAGTVAEELRQAWPGREVAVAIAPGMTCEGDARLLRIVMENLMGNAWKFTTGRSPARIEVGWEQVGDARAYFVRDNGAGFDMTQVRRLFIPFQRLHPAEAFPGHGIGLATVQRILARHGGKAWAEGRPGDGATFFFALTR